MFDSFLGLILGFDSLVCFAAAVERRKAHTMAAFLGMYANCNKNADLLLYGPLKCKDNEELPLRHNYSLLKKGHSFCNWRYHRSVVRTLWILHSKREIAYQNKHKKEKLCIKMNTQTRNFVLKMMIFAVFHSPLSQWPACRSSSSTRR